MDASGIGTLPQIPPGRFGVARSRRRVAPAVASSTGHSTRLPLSLSLSEPVAVQYVVRPMADDSGGTDGTGLSVKVRSIGAVRNSTASAICVQLLLPHGANVREGGGAQPDDAAVDDAVGRAALERPHLSHATPSAVDIGVEHLLEVGPIPPGGTHPIPPHLASIAYVRARRTATAATRARRRCELRLGGCGQAAQALQLARLLGVFGLPKTEQLHDSWACRSARRPRAAAACVAGST